MPLEYYTPIFYNFLLIVIFFVFLKSNIVEIQDNNNLKAKNNLGVFLLIFVIFYMGLRPVSGMYFGDMRTYSNTFQLYSVGGTIAGDKDVYFEYFMKWCSRIMSEGMFFLICAFLYTYPLYLFSKKVFKEYWFYSFLIIVISFSFWGYGVNGIRNGIATSLFLLGISREKKPGMILFLLLSVLVHKSSLILVVVYIITAKYKNSKWLLFFWFLAIPLSLTLGGFWEQFFLNFGFGEEDRIKGYLADEENEFQEQFRSVGFRWDFLLYSFTGVFTGWYFIFKKKFEDVFYSHIYNFYLITNAFWILVIRASFSNRFAYLSWFILGILIVYPFLKNQFFYRQHAVLGKIIVAYFLISYMFNIVLFKQN